jgi:hypothetical protein
MDQLLAHCLGVTVNRCEPLPLASRPDNADIVKGAISRHFLCIRYVVDPAFRSSRQSCWE